MSQEHLCPVRRAPAKHVDVHADRERFEELLRWCADGTYRDALEADNCRFAQRRTSILLAGSGACVSEQDVARARLDVSFFPRDRPDVPGVLEFVHPAAMSAGDQQADHYRRIAAFYGRVVHVVHHWPSRWWLVLLGDATDHPLPAQPPVPGLSPRSYSWHTSYEPGGDRRG